jgi:hypothetical protein
MNGLVSDDSEVRLMAAVNKLIRKTLNRNWRYVADAMEL